MSVTDVQNAHWSWHTSHFETFTHHGAICRGLILCQGQSQQRRAQEQSIHWDAGVFRKGRSGCPGCWHWNRTELQKALAFEPEKNQQTMAPCCMLVWMLMLGFRFSDGERTKKWTTSLIGCRENSLLLHGVSHTCSHTQEWGTLKCWVYLFLATVFFSKKSATLRARFSPPSSRTPGQGCKFDAPLISRVRIEEDIPLYPPGNHHISHQKGPW